MKTLAARFTEVRRFPSILPSPARHISSILLTSYVCVGLLLSANAVSPPQISAIGLAGEKINLSWAGMTGTYEIQTAADPAAINWTTILHTARTNAFIPMGGNSGFFRVIATDASSSSLVVTTTNVSSGDVFTLTRQAQTNGDLVFDNLTDTNASVPVQVVLPVADRQQFDIAFNLTGGFTVVTTNGEPGGAGGQLTTSPGPGASQVTYSGFITNGANMVLFSSISGPAVTSPGVRPLESGPGDAGGPGDVGSGAFNAVWCSSAWALQNLGCQVAAVSRGPGCVGFFPPKPRGGYGYISAKTGVTLVVTATNIILSGSCDSHCITCCKDLFTGALTDCTQ